MNHSSPQSTPATPQQGALGDLTSAALNEEALRLSRMTLQERASRMGALALELADQDQVDAECAAYEAGRLARMAGVELREASKMEPRMAAAYMSGRIDVVIDAADEDRALSLPCF